MKSILIFFLTLLFVSCKSSSEISFVVDSVNDCSEGSNQIEVDEKAYYDEKSKSLIIYNGENPNRTLKKWIIPLSELNPENVYYENINFPYIVTIIPNGSKKIKYYENDIQNDSLSQFSYPIHDYCLDKKGIDRFVKNYRNAIKSIKE